MTDNLAAAFAAGDRTAALAAAGGLIVATWTRRLLERACAAPAFARGVPARLPTPTPRGSRDR
jgi:hypothetical protein